MLKFKKNCCTLYKRICVHFCVLHIKKSHQSRPLIYKTLGFVAARNSKHLKNHGFVLCVIDN